MVLFMTRTPSLSARRRCGRSTRYMADTIARPPMIIRAVMLSPPSATANAAAHTGSIAMITAARDGSMCAWAQVCNTIVKRAGDQREVNHHKPVVDAAGQLDASRADPGVGQSAATAAHQRDHGQLHQAEAQCGLGSAEPSKGDDVPGVDHRRDECQQLAVADREAVQCQHAEPDRGEHRRQPGRRRDPAAQDEQPSTGALPPRTAR